MKNYRISLNGCDDATHIDILLSSGELAFVQRLATLSEQNAAYGCQPVLKVKEIS